MRHIHFSPYNWSFEDGRAVTNCAGAYLDAYSEGRLVLRYDTSQMRSDFELCYSVDGSPLRQLMLPCTEASFEIEASGMVRVVFWRSTVLTDRWNTRECSLVLVGVESREVDPLPNPPPPTQPWQGEGIRQVSTKKRILFLGDSIGLRPYAYTAWLGKFLDADYGTVCFGGRGIVRSVLEDVPPAATHWRWLDAQRALSIEPVPDLFVIHLGVNDALLGVPEDEVRQGMMGLLQEVVVATPAQVAVLVPFGQQNAGPIRDAVMWTNGELGTEVRLLDLGEEAAYGLTQPTKGGTDASEDGIHPNPETHERLAWLLAPTISGLLEAE